MSLTHRLLVLYGIPNCDTVRKARGWLTERGVPHRFHDFKKEGVPAERLDAWIAEVGCDALLNRKGPTWRKLDAAVQDGARDAAGAKALMLAHPSVIKRPVAEWSAKTTVGFDAAQWALLAGC
jgi:arsenate reductase (glutaredoxin)